VLIAMVHVDFVIMFLLGFAIFEYFESTFKILRTKISAPACSFFKIQKMRQPRERRHPPVATQCELRRRNQR
jgi:hypothetical protein